MELADIYTSIDAVGTMKDQLEAENVYFPSTVPSAC